MGFMSTSLRISTVSGIGIYIHWTFWLLVAGVLGFFYYEGGLEAASMGLAYVAAIFLCVVLHELGHALTAKRFSVSTRDITLYPIGGMARLERIPEDPAEEFWIAIAGPAVNLAIAVLLVLTLTAAGVSAMPVEPLVVGVGFFANLMWLNLALVVFNMLPAFPMDGGRVLRALLAANMSDYGRATQIASNVGKGMAILFGLIGLFTFDVILLFIAMFVFFGAQQEAQHAMMRTITHSVSVRQAMMRRFATLAPDDTLADAVEELLSGSEQDFPVVEDERVVGMLTRSRLMEALQQQPRDTPIAEVAQQTCATVEDTAMLREAFDKIRQADCSTVPVVRDGKIVGLLTMENVGELMMISSALKRAGNREDMEVMLKRARGHDASADPKQLPPAGDGHESQPPGAAPDIAPDSRNT